MSCVSRLILIEELLEWRNDGFLRIPGCSSGQPSCRPGPLEVEAPDATVAVQNFANEIQTRRNL
jgi:hypothetical protein